MKTTVKGVMLVSLAAMSLGLTACKSKEEKAADSQADAIRESADATADAVENSGDKMGGASEDAMDNKADAIRKSADATADAVENSAKDKH